MKKILLSALFIMMAGLAVKAQNSSTGAYSNGDNIFNIGIGLGSPFFGTGFSSSFPVNPSVSYERGITDEISVGAQVSYASSKYNYALLGSAYSFKESATYIGLRGAYHLNDILSIPNNFDVYGGASAGYVIVTVSDNQGYSGSAASAAGFGAFAGGKYYFAPSTAVYAELGYQSLAFLNVGISFRF